MVFFDVFCCRQVRLLLVRSTSVAVAAFGAQVAVSSSSTTPDKTSEDKGTFFYDFTHSVRHLSMQFWDLFVLQWHDVLLSAGAFGGVRAPAAWCFAVGRCFCCWCGPQVGVGGKVACCR